MDYYEMNISQAYTSKFPPSASDILVPTKSKMPRTLESEINQIKKDIKSLSGTLKKIRR